MFRVEQKEKENPTLPTPLMLRRVQFYKPVGNECQNTMVTELPTLNVQ